MKDSGNRVVRVKRFGDPEGLEVVDAPMPKAGRREVRVRVLASGLEYTIMRPSFVFGKGGALPTFLKQVRLSPVVTVIGPGTQRSQPIWVEDVAAYFARAFDELAHPLVRRDEQQQQRESPLRRLGGFALRVGRGGG